MIQRIHYNLTPKDVAESITTRIFEVADASSHPLRVALSGGSTPASLFSYWCEIPQEIIRRGIHFWWVDERMVPETSEDSNYGNASRQFFSLVNYPLSLLHPISYTGGSTIERAKEYNAEFKGLDIAILGMGSDGHTSSLFQGQDLFDLRTSYIASKHPTNGIERVALSYKGIRETPLVFFHIMGEDKRVRLTEVIELSERSEEESKMLPAAFVIRQSPSVEIFTDIRGIDTLP